MGRVFRRSQTTRGNKRQGSQQASPRAAGRVMFGNEALCTHSRDRAHRREAAVSVAATSPTRPCAHTGESASGGQEAVEGAGIGASRALCLQIAGSRLADERASSRACPRAGPLSYTLIASRGKRTSGEVRPCAAFHEPSWRISYPCQPPSHCLPVRMHVREHARRKLSKSPAGHHAPGHLPSHSSASRNERITH